MKHVLTVLALCLTAIIAGCAENPALEARYEAEKMFHEAERMLRDARIKPELNEPGTRAMIQDKFGEVTRFCYSALATIDSAAHPVERMEIANLAYHASVRHSQYLFADKKYDSCLTLARRLITVGSLPPYQEMFASVNLGQILQASGKWEEAVAEYNRAVEEYYPPVVPDGDEVVFKLFNIPAHVFNIYRRIGDRAAADEYFLRAETYYRELMSDFAGHRVATAAKTNLASLYDITGRWDMAIAELSGLKDSSGSIPLSATMQIAEIAGFHKGNLDTAMTIYAELMQKLSGPDTMYLPVVMFKQSMIHLDQNRYGQARATLNDLSDRFPAYFNANPTAQLIKARSFDLEGNWARAETEYRFLIENYVGSDEAMSTHLYLEEHYSNDGREAEADRWFDRSLQHFDLLAGRGGALGAKALTYKAELYRQRKMWPEAATALEHLYSGFPDTRLGQKAILTAAALYKERLDKPQVADSLIEVFKRTQTETDQQPE